MGLGGNVFEFEESSGDLLNSSGDNSFRGLRGGFWESDSSLLPSSAREIMFPSVKSYDIGFRVASLSSSAPPPVPEPSMMVIGSLFGLGGLIAKRRLKK
jgi:hypothetical protein